MIAVVADPSFIYRDWLQVAHNEVHGIYHFYITHEGHKEHVAFADWKPVNEMFRQACTIKRRLIDEHDATEAVAKALQDK